LLYSILRRRLGAPAGDPEAIEAAYLGELLRNLRASRFVKAAVVLALDGVYDARGDLDEGRTHLYVTNDAVLELARREHVLLAGASINPARRDAIDELERVAEGGAVLIKWLPNAQEFDPAAAAYRPFYRRLAALGMPLLIHSGVEYSVVRSTAQDHGDPARWRLALDEGVRVIGAHGGSTGLFFWERYARTVFDFLERYPNLIVDSSALGIPSRTGMLLRLLANEVARDRLTFGTDYPLPCFPSLLLTQLRPRAFLATRREANYFDRQVLLFQSLGWEPTSEPWLRLADRAGESGSSD